MAKLFGVRDIKANCFTNVFHSVSKAAAIRGFATASNDPNSEICMFPAEFELYCIGEVDMSSGVVKCELQQLAVATDLKEKPKAVAPLFEGLDAQKESK